MEQFNLNEQQYIEMKTAANRKSMAKAYILWLLLGGLGVHRFYLGRVVSGCILLALSLFLGWWTYFIVTGIWELIDLFLIPGMVRKYNNQQRLIAQQELLLARQIGQNN